MGNRIEKTYGTALKGLFHAVNPLKKKFLKTYCTVHKFIMLQSLDILKNNKYEDAYNFFKENLSKLNEGTTWADQDFKSSNHFFHFSKGKGLYGFSNALLECKKYHRKSLEYLEKGDLNKAMFFLGAACHLIQDVTVPQHVNNKLLKSHRRFELWIISKLLNDYSFMAEDEIVRYSNLDEYIVNNSFLANNTYIKYINIKNREEKYNKIASIVLKEAQKTTAGFLLDYYEDVKNKESFLNLSK
ncbi:phospholipase C [Clostridium cochlearium]|uniref:phospholipase C n=2 Tax=Clostridium cochlearium TaxID=1494 RepID=UPI000B94F4A4|nr:phospholipase C [Clostridium cochlearium]MBV1819260.1 zinc dependent phospholipase C family protein [Bacteroidales bacterium MSK.15.36]NSJ90975.1 phospholipase [Coprococcus sp. MSK.21.13]MBU5269301.1 zinc dependent phospholipase C family protein [Clostridium cochlearium]MCG4572315.1 zinc dependent phospholipase C family protein [Clostridium cochlearium]MCG4578820.1 zinc dependent phospholipase C family protein [Clostridium cochlearium]